MGNENKHIRISADQWEGYQEIRVSDTDREGEINGELCVM